MNFSHSHVTVVDSQLDFAASTASYLRDNGLRVTELRSGQALLQLMPVDRPDIVLLDSRLPDSDCLSITQDLHERWRCGLIVVTERETMNERVSGLEVGADDYVNKRIDQRELLARVRAVLRRMTSSAPPSVGNTTGRSSEGAETFSFHGWHVDTAARRVRDGANAEASLTMGEFDLLCVLLRNAGQVLTRNFISMALRGEAQAETGRSVDVQISRLRKKLELDPRRPQIIKSVRRLGYMLTPD